jgi:hypothetical protein
LFLWDCQLDWVGVDCFACLYEDTGYLTSPSRRDPQKKYIPKGDGTPEKGKGGFSILGGNIRTWKKRRGVGGLFVIQSAKQTGAKCVGCAY